MPLFHPRIIEKHYKSISPMPQEHESILTLWSENLAKGVYDGEIQNDAEFIQRILIDVLGYVGSSSGDSWTVAKNETIGRGNVDVALGKFSAKESSIVATFELKGAKTRDLDAIMSGRNKSPVQQAWEYAMDAKGTKWVLVSNYREIRLYAVGYGRKDYEKFDLSKLTEPINYARFILLLSADSLLGDQTLALLKESESKDNEITDKLYKDYKTLRARMIDSLSKNNPDIPVLKIVQYTQMILDRILFVAFAEDRGLLPNDTLKSCYEDRGKWNPQPAWENFKALFHSIDKGNPPLNIPGYNGGLFAQNDALISLNVSDELCEGFKIIGGYDFESDVSVNILGHIFEQSISDLEEIKANISGEGISFDRKKSRRKKEGIFYTPAYITRYIVEQAVGGWLNDRKKEFGFDRLPELKDDDYASIHHIKKGSRKGRIIYNKKIEQHIKAWETYKDLLFNIKVLDPACGSGAFLNEVFDYLYSEGQMINNELTTLNAGQAQLFRWDTHILANNIFGVDINRESVEITKLSLWLKTANRNEKLTYLDDNIKCGNSLIDASEVAGEKAFNWEEEFPEIMADGGFDVVIGNPPWGAKVDKLQKKYIQENYICTSGEIETYIHFIDLAIRRLVKRNGYVGLITPNTWYYLDKYFPIRKLTLDSSLKILVELEKKIFIDAPDIVPAIFIVKKEGASSDYQVATFKQKKGHVPTFLIDDTIFIQSNINTLNWKSFDKSPFNLILTDELKLILFKMKLHSSSLVENYIVRYGIKTGDNKRFLTQRPESSGNWKYCLPSASCISRYVINWEGDFLNYGDHLSGYTKNPIEKSKILVQYIRKLSLERRLICALDDSGQYYPLNNFSFIMQKTDEFSLYFLLAVLNSNLMNFYFKNVHIDYNIKPKYIEKLPIQLSDLNTRTIIESKVTELMKLYEELIFKREKFHRRLKDNFDIEKLNTNLSHFYENDFKSLLIDLRKQKIELSLKQQEEWEDFFTSRKNEIAYLQSQISSCEDDIDRLVYKLYDISDEEIQLVENSY